MPSPVSIWTTLLDGRRSGWTVSSFLVADGDPAQLVGLLDEDSDLADAITESRTVAVSLLGWQHRALADAFAGVAPAPGGAFRLGTWTDTAWGPVLDGAVGWAGGRLTEENLDHAGWGLLVRVLVEQVGIADAADDGVLAYLHGRYRRLTS
jgi:flavin reductase (DIM6/NTAB) family NADH-FMN oxidoreductase RutF